MIKIELKGRYTGLVRMIRHALWKYKEANSNLWVSSLCYYTILSLVPIFALFFSIGSWLGLGEYLIQQIGTHSPLEQEVIQLLLEFSHNLLENARNGLLAGLGFFFLVWTLISMFSIIEKSFNDIWDVHMSRRFVRKISDYLTFFILLPSLIFISNAANIFMSGMVVGKAIPYLSALLFFMALFMVMPNTEVKVLPAFVASFFTSIMFSALQHTFVYLQVLINTYNRIYGSFSVVFIFLIWLRIVWFLIILGAHLCYLLQNRDYDVQFIGEDVNSLSFTAKYSLALDIVQDMLEEYRKGFNLVRRDALVQKYHSSVAVDGILRILKQREFILEGRDEKGHLLYSFAVNVEQTSLKDLYMIVADSGKRLQAVEDKDIPMKELEVALTDIRREPREQ